MMIGHTETNQRGAALARLSRVGAQVLVASTSSSPINPPASPFLHPSSLARLILPPLACTPCAFRAAAFSHPTLQLSPANHPPPNSLTHPLSQPLPQAPPLPVVRPCLSLHPSTSLSPYYHKRTTHPCTLHHITQRPLFTSALYLTSQPHTLEHSYHRTQSFYHCHIPYLTSGTHTHTHTHTHTVSYTTHSMLYKYRHPTLHTSHQYESEGAGGFNIHLMLAFRETWFTTWFSLMKD
ncbi:hypothetical protein E2C01_099478 [Portunus trituberculatus]|uniref:Uncharacterized protein n=1 Tax=Portunus trituberculatus TaxID=210409 RepID=A0A5B7KAV9_PORTR|nr:hypothetical protein [Portunus trituberculatus]